MLVDTTVISRRTSYFEHKRGFFSSEYFLFSILLILLLIRINWILKTGVISDIHLEESLLELTAAKNFLQFGYFTNFLTPDYVISSDKLDHPFLYTHFPALASILLSYAIKFGFGIENIRILCSIFDVFGIYLAYKFISLIFNVEAGIVSTILVGTMFVNFFIWNDHFIYGFTLCLLFYPCILALNPIEKKNKFLLALIFFLTSLFNYKILITQAAFASVVSYFYNRKYFFEFTKLLFFVISTGIGLHIIQNIITLGMANAISELSLTLQNRVFGAPSTGELQTWFRSHNLVNWGAPEHLSSSDKLQVILTPIYTQLNMLKYYITWHGLLLIAVLIALDISKIAFKIKDLLFISCTFVVASTWAIFFPAHAKGYSLLIAESIGIALLVSYIYGLVFERFVELSMFVRSFCTLIATIPFFFWTSKFITDYNFYISNYIGYYKLLDDTKIYRGKSVWTNSTSVFYSYFIEQPVPGRCTIKSITDNDITQCNNYFINTQHKENKYEKPEFFIFSKILMSGNMADSSPEKLDEFRNILMNKGKIVMSNKLYEVFKID